MHLEVFSWLIISQSGQINVIIITYLLTAPKNVIIFPFMDKIKNTINRAVLNLLYPIVQLLLRYEIAHSEFEEIARRSYVDVAFKDFALPNRKNTVSRVSVLTGRPVPQPGR